MFTTYIYEDDEHVETIITSERPKYSRDSKKLIFGWCRQLIIRGGIAARVYCGGLPVATYIGTLRTITPTITECCLPGIGDLCVRAFGMDGRCSIDTQQPVLTSEAEEVSTKIKGLELFTSGEDYSSLTAPEKSAVSIQLSTLRGYLEALNFRITLHSN